MGFVRGEGPNKGPAPESRPHSGEAQVPEVLDHILLGCSDLERGIAFVEEKMGVKAAFGGVHPGRGTQNALLSLGERHYLEIIAPDPKQAGTTGSQSSVERLKLRELAEPRLVTWAAHPGNLAAFAEKLKKARVAAEGPTPGSRKRPDGRVLEWKTVNLADDVGGLLPFFIEWSAESVHPSVDALKGCAIEKFWVESPDAEELAKKFRLIGVEVQVGKGDKARLKARIKGPKGEMEL
jgi:catechol 2,3-dioxygenase-like lactoylglutathione lyase family enzyme